MSWYVYMIRTDKGSLYTGVSTDVVRRFQEHLDVYLGALSKRLPRSDSDSVGPAQSPTTNLKGTEIQRVEKSMRSNAGVSAKKRVNITKGAKFFRTQRPLKIVYRREFENRSAAQCEEYRIKRLCRKQKEALVSAYTQSSPAE